MSSFKVFRAIIAIFVIAMFVGVPIVTAETAVIRGAGRGTETTFSGTSSSEGSVSMMAGHSASAQIGFHQVQTGKGTTSQTIHGGSELATDPFATVQIGNADVSVSATVTGKGTTAATGVAEASGFLNASADEDDSTNPTGVNVTTSIASFANATTGPRGTSAVAVASASGFALGNVAVTNGEFSLTAGSDTEGSTSAYAAATAKNSHASAESTIIGEGNAGTGAGPLTGNRADAGVHINGIVEGKGTASASAEGGSEVTTLYSQTGGDSVGMDAEAGGLAETTITARNGLTISGADIEGSATSVSAGDFSDALIGNFADAEGHVSVTTSVMGGAEAGTASNLSGNTADTESVAGGILESGIELQSGYASITGYTETDSDAESGNSSSMVESIFNGMVSGSGSVYTGIDGDAFSGASANVSGNTTLTTSSSNGLVLQGSGETNRGSLYLFGGIYSDGDAEADGDTHSAVIMETNMGADGTASGETSATSADLSSETVANVTGFLYQTDTNAFGSVNSSLESFRINSGHVDSGALMHGGSETGPEGHADSAALSRTDAFAESQNTNSAGAATGFASGSVISGSNSEDLISHDTLTSSAGTGMAVLMSEVDQAGAGYSDADADLHAGQYTNDIVGLPLLTDYLDIFIGANAIGSTNLAIETEVEGTSKNFEGYAGSWGSTDNAGTLQTGSDGGDSFFVVTDIYDATAESESEVLGRGYAEDSSLLATMSAFEPKGMILAGDNISFESDLLSLTIIEHMSMTETVAKGAEASASGVTEGDAYSIGDYADDTGNGSTWNHAFGSVSTGSSSVNKNSESFSLGMLGGLQAVDLTAMSGVGPTVFTATDGDLLIDDGILTATFSASMAEADGLNAFASSETGGFDQGTFVSGELAENNSIEGLSLEEISFSSTLGELDTSAAARRNAESFALAGAGSFDITGVDAADNLITEGGSGIITVADGASFGRRASGTASASAVDIATSSDGIMFADDSVTQTGLNAARDPVSSSLTHHSGLSDDASSIISVHGGNATVPNSALALTFAGGFQRAKVDPYEDFNGTSTSYAAFAALAMMNGPVNADAETSDVDITSLASTSGSGAEPTSAQIFFTNSQAVANLVGKPLSGESGANIQAESLIGVGPNPGAVEIIADSHSTSPQGSFALGYGIGVATSDQNAL